MIFPAAVFTLTAAYFCVWARGTARLIWTAPLIPLAAMALWSWLPPALDSMLWTAYLTLAFLATQLFADPKLRRGFQQFAILFGAIAGAFAIFHLPLLPNRNHYAALIELLLPLACWQLVTSRKPVYALAGGIMFLSVVMSASRTGIVLVSAELLILAFAGVRRARGISWKPLAAAAAVVIILAATLGATAWKRFGNLRNDAETSSRGYTAKASLAMLRERPLTGFGLGTWRSVYPRFAEIDTGFDLIHADDDWLEWAAEGGLPFIGFVLLIAAIAVRNAWYEPWSIGLLSVLLHSLTEFPLQKPAVMSWFVVLLAMSAIARRQQAS